MTSKRIYQWFIGTSIVLFFISLTQVDLEYARLTTGFKDFAEMLLKMFPPANLEWDRVLEGVLESWHIAVVGTSIAIVISLFLSLTAASNVSPMKGLSSLVKGFAALMRVIPVFIWALIFVVSLGMGPLAGIMALAVHSLGMLIKVYAESIEEVKPGIIEAMRSTGAGWWSMMMRGVIPSAMTSILSWSLFRLEIDLRYSTILGMVGAGGIGLIMLGTLRMYNLQATLSIILIMFAMIFTVEFIGSRIKARWLNGPTKRTGVTIG